MSNQENQVVRKLTEQEQIRVDKIEWLRSKGVDPFGHKFAPTHYSVALQEKYAETTKEELEEMAVAVKVAGRIMTKRGKGKAGFMHIQDNDGQIQIYLRQDKLSEVEFELFQKCDIGDIVGIVGTVFKTKTGEVSVKATEYHHLTKALKPLPEKFHGLTDDETRLRKRYLDIIMDRDVKEIFLKKQKFWATIRNYMIDHDFLEVETPILETSSGGAAATPFATHHNALDIDVFLRISMGELWQKKLLVAGYEKTFEIGRQFRNEGMSPEHLQDYTQMEFYWAYADIDDGMEFTKDLYRKITHAVMGSSKFTTRGFDIDMDAEWKIYDFETIIEETTGVNVFTATKEEVEKRLDDYHVEFDPNLGYWRLIDVLWKVVRKDLSGPGFLVGQPVQLNPLPKRMPGDDRKVAQMQIILAGSEMGNGYTELNDPLDLESRFKEQREMGEAGDEEAHEHDETFIEALRYGMPPAYGFGVSERLFSVMMDKPIRECVAFPLMRPRS
ncbi:lysine--tRNA ligase [Acidaminobacter sp. JC074]|uniref:lysine--tRNA ligase n=1 Tax=Acidaminobacter sp. JC074 TaxID=2530199 RepID=UPI001F0E2BDE|nr:lysine--tRNA ligase [Acidaminobacter sp. JC074]MCH4888326.1 lysine--tRNA ligase [Acidaminobacter sp. JC074]